MTDLNSRAAKILAVHGVGYCGAGEVPTLIKEQLQDTDKVVVDEVHWSELLEPRYHSLDVPFSSGMDFATLTRINRSLLTASLIDFVPDKPNRSSYLDSLSLAADTVIFSAASFGLFAFPMLLFLITINAISSLISPLASWSFYWPLDVTGKLALLAIGLSATSIITGQILQCRFNGTSRREGFLIALRRIALVAISQLYTSCVFPFISSWMTKMLLVVAGLAGFFAVMVIPVKFLLYCYLRIVGLPHDVVWSDTMQLLSMAWLLAFVCAICFGIVYLMQVIVRLLTPFVKILADIALYLGNADHRAELIRRVEERAVAATWPNGVMILCAHSLGTAILIDFLRHRLASGGLPGRVLLVTMGSPLLRWFHRFFPRQYPSPRNLSHLFRAGFHDFAWVNIYRPLDPVGAKLSLSDQSWSEDRSTKQLMLRSILLGNPMAPHIGYFSDEIVHKQARTFLEPRYPQIADDLVPTVYPRRTVTQRAGRIERFKIKYRLKSLRLLWGWTAVALFAIVAYWTFVQIPSNLYAIEKRLSDVIVTRGIEVQGTVHATQESRAWLPGTTIPLTVPSYFAKVAFRPLSSKVDVTARGLLTDDKRFFGWAEKEGVSVKYDPLFFRKFRRENVRVIYDPTDPKRCIVPEFQLTKPKMGSLFSVGNDLVLLLAFGLIVNLWIVQAGIVTELPENKRMGQPISRSTCADTNTRPLPA